MTDIQILKEQEALETPILLFDCELPGGETEHWCSHRVTVSGRAYDARVLRHNLFDLKTASEDGYDGVSRISIVLSNADGHFSQIARNEGLKGAKITVRFVFYSLLNGAAASETQTVFVGVGNAPDEINESSIQLTFTNRMSLQRVVLPGIRIQRRCPWMFPATEEQRSDAISGGSEGKYGNFYRCGYSAGVAGGVGNAGEGGPFPSCDYSRRQCEERGMFDADASGQSTKRFGGIEFVPSDITVRSYGERGSHLSATVENQARYNDFVPLVYGTAWYEPPIVFARNDGNLTRMEVLLGAGEIDQVMKVIVNDIEIPQGVSGANMTGTGWFNVVSTGGRNGGFNLDFTDGGGRPLGDPYGSMAFASVVVPNRIADGKSLPRIKVLIRGLKLQQFNSDGGFVQETFSDNPAWVLLDVFRRSGWKLAELDLRSFAKCADFCAQPVAATDVNGNPVMVARYRCNLALTQRRSAGDVVRGIRTASSLLVRLGATGLLEIQPESTLAIQQPVKPATSNSVSGLDGGWPAYEFGDGTTGVSGLMRKADGTPALRLWSRSNAETANRLSIEFQDELNEYQQDSLSVVDVDDAALVGQEISASLSALGIPNFSQAGRVLRMQLWKGIEGNEFVEFTTSVRGVGLLPGDIITVTYQKEGLNRQPYRIVRLTPGLNYQTVKITAQRHSDSWYESEGSDGSGRRQREFEIRVPVPLAGTVANADGTTSFGIAESATANADNSMNIELAVNFVPPAVPSAGFTGVPILSLSTAVDTEGGTLAGGATYYYGITAADAEGGESGLSFVARASTAEGGATNRVTLSGISLPNGAALFHVYRGSTPSELLRIASNVAAAATFADDGKAASLVRPPDASFDHANFYWRLELIPETQATVFSATTVGAGTLGMIADENRGMAVRITRGTGAGQEAIIASNTNTVLTLATPWVVTPDASSAFVVTESSWHFGARGMASPVRLDVPNRAGTTVHVLGRSANAFDEECAEQISPLTRWQIGGAGGGDAEVPEAPTFALTATGRGTVEVGGIGFPDLTNTHSITAGTLTVGYWSELDGANPYTLLEAISDSADTITLGQAGPGQAGQWIQIDREVLVISDVIGDGSRYLATRGAFGSAAAAHSPGAGVYHLERRTFVLPFGPDFFGSPASGSYYYAAPLPDARVAAAEMFVTNSKGNSDAARNCYTFTTDSGIRTLSGGQYVMQLEGYLAVQAEAAPAMSIDSMHAVRDVFATVREAPSSGPVQLTVKVNGAVFVTLTVPAGATVSNVVSGFGLAALPADGKISLDVTAVGSAANPGRDLTVTIRL